MINFKKYIEEKRGLWDNIHAKQERIKNGSGERMRKPGSKGAPTAQDFKNSQTNEEVEYIDEGDLSIRHLYNKFADAHVGGGDTKSTEKAIRKVHGDEVFKHMKKAANANAKGDFDGEDRHFDNARNAGRKTDRIGSTVGRGRSAFRKQWEEVQSNFDLIEDMVNDIAEQHNLDPEMVWEKFEKVSDEELFEAAVDAKGYKSSTGGLTQKGRDHYNRTEGGNLKAPVTTKPSKLKPGSKAANRRKSFCARMSGVEGPMKKPNGEPTRKALALRKWNC